mmetsp:Transcript_16525/g.34100  ORF Transcript_16525/g.34100 Transcript_16525/m.34100 type:complete len:574 (+) Transcript_16525:49-1770(+)
MSEITIDDRQLLKSILESYERQTQGPLSSTSQERLNNTPSIPSTQSLVPFLLPPPTASDTVIHVNRQSVCTFKIEPPNPSPYVAIRLTSVPVSVMERLFGYEFGISVEQLDGDDDDDNENNDNDNDDNDNKDDNEENDGSKNPSNNNAEDNKLEFESVPASSSPPVSSNPPLIIEEVLPLTLHTPSFDPTSSDSDVNLSPETNPFQAVIKLNHDATIHKSFKIKVTLDNSRSVFRPRRLVFQCAFFDGDVYKGAVDAAAESEASLKDDGGSPTPTPSSQFLDSMPAKVIGGLLIGGASGGGIGALAGGMVVVGGLKVLENMKSKESDLNDVDSAPSPTPTIDEQVAPEASVPSSDSALVSSLSTEIINLQTDLSNFEEERRRWEVDKATLRKAANEATSRLASLKKNIANERKLGHRREEELVRSVVELEGTVRKLKREKKVLVAEVRRAADERERVTFELRSELEEKNINLRVAERRIRKLSGEEEKEKNESSRGGTANKVDTQLAQLRTKLKSLQERKVRGEGVEGGGVDVLIREVSSAIRLLEQHKTILEGSVKDSTKRKSPASSLNFKN